MKARTIAWVFLMCVVGNSIAIAEEFPFQEVTFETALKEAKVKKQPIMVKAFTTWCGPCKRMDKTVFNTAEMTALAPQFIAIKVDGDSDYGQAFNGKNGVSRYPTTLFFDASGKEVHRITGVRELPAFLKLMDSFLKGTLRPEGSLPELTTIQIAIRTAFQQVIDQPAEEQTVIKQLLIAVEGGTQEEKAMAEYLQGEWDQRRNRNNAKSAIKTLRSNINKHPRTIGADLSVLPLATALASTGKHKNGLRLLLDQLKKAPADGKLRSGLRLAQYILESEREVSKKVLETLKTLTENQNGPELGPLLVACSDIEEKQGRLPEEKSYLSRAAELYPEHPWYQTKLSAFKARVP